jgi:hypothetical protein
MVIAVALDSLVPIYAHKTKVDCAMDILAVTFKTNQASGVDRSNVTACALNTATDDALYQDLSLSKRINSLMENLAAHDKIRKRPPES